MPLGHCALALIHQGLSLSDEVVAAGRVGAIEHAALQGDVVGNRLIELGHLLAAGGFAATLPETSITQVIGTLQEEIVLL